MLCVLPSVHVYPWVALKKKTFSTKKSNLKRPREEVTKAHHVTKSHPNKRYNTHNAANLIQQNQSQETNFTTAKIIVNSFHASSLLNSKNGDFQTRLLTQSGPPPNSRLTHKTKIPTNFPAQSKSEESQQVIKIVTTPVISPSLETHQSKKSLEKVDSPPDDDTCSHPNVDDDDNNSVDDIGGCLL